MPLIPERLRRGDTVGLIAPASAPMKAEAIDRSVTLMEDAGFKVKLGRHARRRLGYLAGDDRERAADLMAMFADRGVRGVFCLRGGYGTARLLPRLDYGTIRRNPKVFVGFSDITSLHCAFLKKTGLLTFHGPMVASYLIKRNYPQFSRESLWRAIMEPAPAGGLCRGYTGGTVRVLRRGKVSGELIGGNLVVFCALLGTEYQPDLRGRILYLEEVSEKPYRIDRMLTHLLNAGVLQSVAGVAVGVCHGCDLPRAKTGGGLRQTLEGVLRDRLLPLKVPVVIGLPFGHIPHNATLPAGGHATLDGDHGDLIITRAAVR